MALRIPDGGLLLESSAKSMAVLPAQAFAISLSDSVIEDMIACVQNGQDIRLSLGDSPSFLFGEQVVQISESPDFVDCDLFQTNTAKPVSASKLQHPTMSIFKVPKYKNKPPAAPQVERAQVQAQAQAQAQVQVPTPARVSKPSTKKSGAHVDREIGNDEPDDAIAKLKNATAKAEHDKYQNSVRIVDRVPTKGGKYKQGIARPLGSQPSSPALHGVASPSVESTSSSNAQTVEKSKKHRFPIIHELALQAQTFAELREKWTEGSDSEFKAALDKIANFDNQLQKFELNKLYWKDLDVFKYGYATEEDRQKVIVNAIKQYDRMRLPPSDDVWDRLLPEADRGKGICLSKLSAKIGNGLAAPTPKINVQKPEGSSASGDSEKDDSASAPGKKAKGGEPMSRSSSQTKKAAGGEPMSRSSSQTKKAAGGGEPMSRSSSQTKKAASGDAQLKRILSGNAKKIASSKPSPKASPTKAAAKTGSAAKSSKIKSSEFVTDSDSDDEETPLAASVSKTKAALAPSDAERGADKPKDTTDKPVGLSAPKPKPKPTPLAVTQSREKKNTIEALPPKSTKRSRDDDEDSSSSGTPLSKRLKKPRGTHQSMAHQSMAQARQAASREQQARQQVPSTVKQHHRTVSDASSSKSLRAGSTGGAMASLSKNMNTSPAKSSPLASSPPTNASDLENERALAREREKAREAEKARERERVREIEKARERERVREREKAREKVREREREKEREREREERQRERDRARELERDRETVVSSSSSIHDGDSSSGGGGGGKKRSADEQSGGEAGSKRQRLSAEILNKANKFKMFYTRYEQLHKDLVSLENPPDDKIADLMDMHERLSKMKKEIYKEVSVE